MRKVRKDYLEHYERFPFSAWKRNAQKEIIGCWYQWGRRRDQILAVDYPKTDLKQCDFCGVIGGPEKVRDVDNPFGLFASLLRPDDRWPNDKWGVSVDHCDVFRAGVAVEKNGGQRLFKFELLCMSCKGRFRPMTQRMAEIEKIGALLKHLERSIKNASRTEAANYGRPSGSSRRGDLEGGSGRDDHGHSSDHPPARQHDERELLRRDESHGTASAAATAGQTVRRNGTGGRENRAALKGRLEQAIKAI